LKTDREWTWRDGVRMVTPPVFLELYRAVRRRTSTARPDPSNPAELPARSLRELFPDIDAMTVEFPVRRLCPERSMVQPTELLALAAVCKYVRPRVVFEIGTYKGACTLVMAMNTPADTEILSLDLPPEARVTKYPLAGDVLDLPYVAGELYRDTPFKERIRQLFGDSASFEFGPYEGRIDLLFIDGNHTYENVKRDTEAGFRMLRPGGVIVWDDYHPDWGRGVMRTLHEITDRRVFQVPGTRFAIYRDPPK
jgi:predicted O-methyltransferase YrrM